MRMLGIVLIVLGALALSYQGFSYVSRDTVVDAGPIKISADREHNVWLPPAVGGIALLSGLALLIVGRKNGAVI